MLDRYKCILGAVGISWIGGIAITGLLLGHNGVLLAGSMTAIGSIIAGLTGYEIGLKKSE
jgi:hypothetical protein